MVDFLSGLNSLVGLSNGTPIGLDSISPTDPDIAIAYGSLGSFASEIDQTAQRSYVETGLIRNIRPRTSDILTQEPDMTVLIKKRMFNSLAENFKPELMDENEKIFYRASKILFQNKCAAINAYERLIKIERVATKQGVLDNSLFPAVFDGLDTLSSFGVNIVSAQTQATLDTIRKVQSLSDPNFSTTWIIDPTQAPLTDVGAGTGVIELTLVSNLTCTSSVGFGEGNASLTIEDPYKLMVITTEDIDKAISQSVSFLNNSFSTGEQAVLKQTIADLTTELNTIRLTRGATNIRFLINPYTLLYQKVRAIIDGEGKEILFTYSGGVLGIGSSVDVDPGAFEGINGLNQVTELPIFQQIVSNIFINLALQQQFDTVTLAFNKQTNYVRREMLLHYGGKNIIQPMDSIHVYMNTTSAIDPKIASAIGSNFTTADVFQSLNNTISNIQGTLDNISSAFGGTTSQYAVAEKDAIAGADFPMWLWSLLRNDFTRQSAGNHVFAGVVTESNHSYNNGKYTLSVSAKDNTYYFQLGRININPSQEVYNGELYNPLTARDLEFNASSGFIRGEEPPLLAENIALLSSNLLKFKNGIDRGTTVTQANFLNYDLERIQNSSTVRRVYSDPDGFVYRWKKGIQALTLLGAPHPTGGFPKDSSPRLTKNPFAGQDVMNVLSLLITGQPYNFNNFVRAAIASGSLNRDSLNNENSSSSFFKGLIGDISKNNTTWGNFIPFKKMILNQSAYTFLRQGEFDVTTSNSAISDLLRERATRFDQLVKIAPQFANNPQIFATNAAVNIDTRVIDTATVSSLVASIATLDAQINQAKTDFFNAATTASNINTKEGSISIFGDDISFDPTVTQTANPIAPDAQQEEQDEFNNKLNYLTQRRLWKVKANEDPNLFIVDDSYDKNYDIQAFEKSLSNFTLFESSYTNVFSQIDTVAQLLGLEVFADSQGHIQVRAPHYNQMPSSVFSTMLNNKTTAGVQIFPPYLESLFVNQIQGLTDRIEIAEDEIRIRGAALGYISDPQLSTILNGSSTFGGNNTVFVFVTDPTTGKFNDDIRVILDQVNPDLTEQRNNIALKEITALIQLPASSRVNFDIGQRLNLVNNTVFGAGATTAAINGRINELGKRLSEKTGNPAPTRGTFISTANLSAGQGISQLDVLNVSKQIATLIGQRQADLKLLSNSLKNLDQGVAFNTSLDTGATSILPFVSQTNVVPDILNHMIEDESFDDYGYNSGKRYVIHDNQIISMRISERPPDYTLVQVNGLFGEGLPEPPDRDFQVDGGNAISTAWAIDFDMWKMYGFRQVETVNAPFLSDPDAQCAPFAVFKLNVARKNIFQGDIMVAGNEFLQPGEVYYVEDRDLLFYSHSVTHSYSYGNSYNTTLNLVYGHSPGEYIPTILDIIGKGLYTNKHQANLARHDRFGNANGDNPINTIVFDQATSLFGSDPLTSLVSGSYGNQNRKALANILLAASNVLSPTSSPTKTYTLELRIYFNSKEGTQVSSSLVNLANSIKTWITNPSQTSLLSSQTLVPDTSVSEINTSIIDPNSIQIIQVDLGSTSETKSPSSGALNRAREIANTSGMPSITIPDVSATPNIGKPQLFGQVIDVWVTTNNKAQVNSIKNGTEPLSQQAIQQRDQLIKNFNSRIKPTTTP